MKKYKSKIGLSIVLFIVIILSSVSTIIIINRAWIGLAILLLIVGFISYTFMTTYYIIHGNDLIIKCGFMYNATIKIGRIKKIVETNNPLSSPATSLDRIMIYFGNSDTIMISPKEKMDFIDQLRATNPKIEVLLKSKNK